MASFVMSLMLVDHPPHCCQVVKDALSSCLFPGGTRGLWMGPSASGGDISVSGCHYNCPWCTRIAWFCPGAFLAITVVATSLLANQVVACLLLFQRCYERQGKPLSPLLFLQAHEKRVGEFFGLHNKRKIGMLSYILISSVEYSAQKTEIKVTQF